MNTVIPLPIQNMSESELIGAINSYGSTNSVGEEVGDDIGNAATGLTYNQRIDLLRLVVALIGG